MAKPPVTPKHTHRGKAAIRWILIYLIPFTIYTIGFIPPILFYIYAVGCLPFGTLWDILLVPLITTLLLGITLLSQFLISGALIKLLGFKYEEGTYLYNIKNRMTFKWMMVCTLYTPFRKISEIIPLGPIKTTYLKLLGMKIGKNTLIGGTIKDPCLTELGNNVTIGEYAVLYAHIQDLQKNTITMQKIQVGDDCVIGAGAMIMPGVSIQDNVIVAAGCIVPKGHTLESKNIYFGNPMQKRPLTKDQNVPG